MIAFRLDGVAARLRIAGACLALAAAGLAHAGDDLTQVRQLQAAGKLDQALSQVDALVAAHPADPRYAFSRGVILGQLGRLDDAIAAYTALIQRYPELPEPYNNLGVLYARQMRYPEARAELDMAVRANPDDALAWRNLGDVDAMLAARAYRKALSLPQGDDASTRMRLRRIEGLFAPVAAPELK